MRVRFPRLFFLFIALCAGVASAAQETAAGMREVRDLPYVAGGVAAQRLDLYLPSTKTPAPLVVWIHGGGWKAGSKSNCPAKGMLKFGYAAASVEYRFSDEAIYPAQIEDCKAAIRFLRAHAGEYGIDPKRIGVWGESAGGHLVALLGATGNIRDFDVGGNLDQSSAVQCVVDWFGPTDFLNWGTGSSLRSDDPDNPVSRLLGGEASTHLDAARRASPLYFVTRESAPFLIMHGEKDPLVPLQQSQELNAALQKAGVESTLKVIPGAGHGGGAFGALENLIAVKDFFEKHLNGKSQTP